MLCLHAALRHRRGGLAAPHCNQEEEVTAKDGRRFLIGRFLYWLGWVNLLAAAWILAAIASEMSR